MLPACRVSEFGIKKPRPSSGNIHVARSVFHFHQASVLLALCSVGKNGLDSPCIRIRRFILLEDDSHESTLEQKLSWKMRRGLALGLSPLSAAASYGLVFESGACPRCDV